jgi:hypothetical protein
MWGLLETIQALLQSAHVLLSSRKNETLWLFHKHFLFKKGLKKGVSDI